MRVAVVGGGPGGLFFATLLRGADPSVEVTVFERNQADNTFGFGVVFSDRTLAGIHQADPVLREALAEHGRHWDNIEVRLKGERIRCGGNGMAAIARKTLLALMQARARDVGATLRFSVEVGAADLDGYDLVVAADGTGSRIRDAVESRIGGELGVEVETASAKFIWFGTDYLFDGLTFVHERGPDGTFAVHGYPISEDVSTFIVETDECSWRRAGLNGFDVTQPAGPSDLASKDYLEKLFAEQIDGRRLLTNNSRWGNFRTRRTKRWHVLHPRPVVLLGDAVHTAHFSVGSGTKMAMEDAIALCRALVEHPDDLAAGLSAYEDAAQPSVRRIQDSARPSLSWWEHFGRYHDAFEPWQFAYHFLSRSITDARLARRAPGFVAASHLSWLGAHGAEPLDTPFRQAGWFVPGRLVAVASDPAGFPVRVLNGSGSGPLVVSEAPVDSQPDGHSDIQSDGHLDIQSDCQSDVWWAARIAAPDSEAALRPVFDRLAQLAGLGRRTPVIVVVHGGTPLTRILVCEHARMHERLPTLVVEPEPDPDRALTLVLSGRTDLVGVPA